MSQETTTEVRTVVNANGKSTVTHRGTRVVTADGKSTAWGVSCSAGSNRRGGSSHFYATEGAITCARCLKMQA